jgi:hypothetical protein
VNCGIAKRVGAEHPGFAMSARADRSYAAEFRLGHLERLEREKWIDCQPDFDTAHYIKGFAYPDGNSASSRTGRTVPFRSAYTPAHRADAEAARPLDHHRAGRRGASDAAGDLAVARLSQFTFNETPRSRAQNAAARRDDPSDDAGKLGIADGRGGDRQHARQVRLHARCSRACAAAC